MQIKIGSKTYEAEPYFINEALIEQGFDPSAIDPYNYDNPYGGYYERRSITAVDYRLLQSTRRKIYEYNCLTKRGATFGLNSSGRLTIRPIIYYIVQKHYGFGPKEHPSWELKLKEAKKLADSFRTDAGLPTTVGMGDPNQAVDRALLKAFGAVSVGASWKKWANKLIPDASFTVSVEVGFSYFRLKFGQSDKEDYIIIGLPRAVSEVREITYVCRAETVGDVKKVGATKPKKPVRFRFGTDFPDTVTFHKAYDKAIAEREEAKAKEKAKTKREKQLKEKERLEQNLKWTQERLYKLKEEIEGN